MPEQATDALTDPVTRILLVQPRYDLVNGPSRDSFWNCVEPGSSLEVKRLDVGGSALPDVFNKAWALAGDLWEAGEIDGWAMIHADVVAENGWLDVLEAERLRVGADVIAAHIPIKSGDGLSSTGVDVGREAWRTPRLTMPQIHALPETVTDADVGGPLLLNTGLWLGRLGPWLDHVWFRFHNWIRKVDGRRRAEFIPEDWDFSRQLQGHGLRLAATRKVQVIHHGAAGYGNQSEGGWDHDRINGDALAGLRTAPAPAVAVAG